MSYTILPEDLKRRIRALAADGYSRVAIFDSVGTDAGKYVDSSEQLSRCISALTRQTAEKSSGQSTAAANHRLPAIKQFDAQKHSPIIASLWEEMIPLDFEQACEKIVVDILENYEGFSDLENANNVDGFHNPPFDFFGCKDGRPYMIEFKGSLKYFHAPGETKKRRLKEIKDQIKDVHMALIQVKLQKAEYRIFYDEEMDLFFDGKHMPCEPVVEWLRDRMKAKCPGS